MCLSEQAHTSETKARVQVASAATCALRQRSTRESNSILSLIMNFTTSGPDSTQMDDIVNTRGVAQTAEHVAIQYDRPTTLSAAEILQGEVLSSPV